MQRPSAFERALAAVQQRIAFRKLFAPLSLWVGVKREEMVVDALRAMQKDGEIIWFARTGRLSFADLMRGIDFFIVAMNVSRRLVVRLAVTGDYWVADYVARHPENPVLAVDVERDNRETLRRKIRRTIDIYKEICG